MMTKPEVSTRVVLLPNGVPAGCEGSEAAAEKLFAGLYGPPVDCPVDEQFIKNRAGISTNITKGGK